MSFFRMEKAQWDRIKADRDRISAALATRDRIRSTEITTPTSFGQPVSFTIPRGCDEYWYVTMSLAPLPPPSPSIGQTGPIKMEGAIGTDDQDRSENSTDSEPEESDDVDFVLTHESSDESIEDAASDSDE
jgi:hypothetical protein